MAQLDTASSIYYTVIIEDRKYSHGRRLIARKFPYFCFQKRKKMTKKIFYFESTPTLWKIGLLHNLFDTCKFQYLVAILLPPRPAFSLAPKVKKKYSRKSSCFHNPATCSIFPYVLGFFFKNITDYHFNKVSTQAPLYRSRWLERVCL